MNLLPDEQGTGPGTRYLLYQWFDSEGGRVSAAKAWRKGCAGKGGVPAVLAAVVYCCTILRTRPDPASPT